MRYFIFVPRRIKDQKIVIVEDEIAINESLRDYLSDQNSVQAFLSAEEALASESSFANVDVFIIDYLLPGENGVELFKHLRSKFSHAKYILITGEMNYDLAESTRKLGLDALILKPFDFMILEDNISAIISTAA